MTGNKVTANEYSSANLLNSPTYVVTSLTAQMQLSSMGTGATTSSQINTGNGTVAAANIAVSLLPLNTFGGNDNVVFYSDMNGSTPFLYTTQSGVSLGYTLPGSATVNQIKLSCRLVDASQPIHSTTIHKADSGSTGRNCNTVAGGR